MTPEERERLSAAVAGKTVASLEWEDEADPRPYWVMTFDDGSEICFVDMAELAAEE